MSAQRVEPDPTELAKALFLHNSADFGDRVTAEDVWDSSPEVQAFWLAQVEVVLTAQRQVAS